MQRYRREAEHRERQRPVELQDWSRFQTWWDASFREFQGYLLTQDETAILKQPEPSIERRTAHTSTNPANVEGAMEANGDTLLSAAEVDALFEDDGE